MEDKKKLIPRNKTNAAKWNKKKDGGILIKMFGI